MLVWELWKEILGKFGTQYNKLSKYAYDLQQILAHKSLIFHNRQMEIKEHQVGFTCQAKDKLPEYTYMYVKNIQQISKI